jgi:hypothetical protein
MSARVEVPADSPGWVDTGVDVQAGQWVTLLATGTAQPAGGPDFLHFAPELFLCHRITPDGTFDKLPAPTTTFRAEHDGRLELVANFPGAWRDHHGSLDEGWPRAAALGTYQVDVLVWPDEPAAIDGLAALAPQNPGARIERRRVLDPARLPAGWQALWRTGATEVYRDRATAAGTWIECRCERDGGLLAYDVDVPLTEQTRLAWQWRVLSLPSRLAEDTLLTHDYLSIAVEFDNGLDLTYMWSSTLPTGTVFGCPLPWWNTHETHQVVRSGPDDLGRWLDEEQPILADYARAIGGPPPQRIVAIWLIAVAVFQDAGPAECEYRGIALRDGDTTLALGPPAAAVSINQI